MQQYAALRAQKTGARAREGEVHEKNDAPRRQNAPHPGERPGISRSLGRRGVTAAGGPHQGPLLTNRAVDASALARLLSVAGDEGAGGAGEERRRPRRFGALGGSGAGRSRTSFWPCLTTPPALLSRR